MSLPELAWRTGNAESSYEHDLVGPLLGLMDAHEAAAMQLDYPDTPALTFVKATFSVILSSRALEILAKVSFKLKATGELPSWVVDFNNVRSCGHEYLYALPIGQGSQMAPNRSPSLDLATGQLMLRGRTFDTVAEAAPLWETAPWKPWSQILFIRSLKAKLRRLYKHASPLSMLSDSHIAKKLTASIPEDKDLDLIPTDANVLNAMSGVDRQFEHQLSPACDLWTRLVHYPTENFLKDWTSHGIRSYEHYASRESIGKKIFFTRCGYIGVGPSAIESGDTIAHLAGGVSPVALRPVGKDHVFSLKAFVYVHGYSVRKAHEGHWHPWDFEVLDLAETHCLNREMDFCLS